MSGGDGTLLPPCGELCATLPSCPNWEWHTFHVARSCWWFSKVALLTESCTVCARPRDISLAPLAESQAPSPQSRRTAYRANSNTWSEINQRESQRAKCCANIDKCEVLSAFKTSLMPCCRRELAKSLECDNFFYTLTSSLWLIARAECSRALMTEV